MRWLLSLVMMWSVPSIGAQTAHTTPPYNTSVFGHPSSSKEGTASFSALELSPTLDPSSPQMRGGARLSGRRGLTAHFLAADTLRRDPDVALRRSLLAPGWGQIYNGDAYKLPFVWGGLAAFGGLAIYNEREYRRMQRVVRFAEFPDEYPEYESDAAEYQAFIQAGRTAPLINLRDSFRRSRDLSVVRFGLWYALTAVDAYVSAHLSDFDADPDFRLTLAPTPDALQLNVVYRF